MKVSKTLAVVGALSAIALGVSACSSGGAASGSPASSSAASQWNASGVSPAKMKFVNVIKVTATLWFGNMENGVNKFASKTGVQASQTGPAQATAEGQSQIIQNLIPQKPAAIGIDPNSEQSAEGVLGQAQKAGILVFSQEAPQLKNTDLNLEAFSNNKFGTVMMDSLASCMGGSGEYATMVGSLTAASHMVWAGAELAEAKAKYPNIQRVTGPVVSNEDSQVAFQKTQELLAKYPKIKGIIGSSSNDAPAIAKAIDQAGLKGKVCVGGLIEPSLAKPYFENGTIQEGYVWDSALTAQAVMNGALMKLQGKKVGVGSDLNVPGYTNIQKCTVAGASPNCYEGDAILKMTKANIGKYNF